MSHTDDTCDFCGGYIDGMGCDTKQLLELDGRQKYWDGQCVEGMDAQWRSYSVDEIEKAVVQTQALYDNDPIDWSVEAKRENYERRLKQLFLQDRLHQLRTYAEHRKATAVQ